MEEIKKSVNGDMPWIIFNLCQNKFAVCSDMISGMTELPSEIVPVPTANKALMGVGVIRGQIVPLINLREFFGMRSLDDEYEEFKEMLEQRKRDMNKVQLMTAVRLSKALRCNVEDLVEY